MNPFAYTETLDLLKVVEQIKMPTTFLQGIFFSEKVQTYQDVLPVEFIRKSRRLAPIVVRGARALNMSREQTTVKLFRAPLIGARRQIGLEEITRRIAGEMPVVSTMTPADRALRLQADDLRDLMNMLTNRREQMSASLLTTGSIPIRGFADDGQIVEEQTIVFDADWVVGVETPWSNANAPIYDDLKAAVEYIGEETGVLPDVAICGRNIEGYLLANNQFKEWAKSFRESLNMVSFAPKFQSPHARYLGSINSLGLELHQYLGSYYDDVSGTTKRYLPDDGIIIGTSGAGQMMLGRVDLMKDGQFTSYVGENIPLYVSSEENQNVSLSLFSRSLPILPAIDAIRYLEVTS